MNPKVQKTLLWLPRVIGILYVLFTSLFALDMFGTGETIWNQILGFFMHLLVPSIMLAVTIALAWRWEWVGVLGFGGWGLFYLFQFGSEFGAGVVNVIAGFPLVIGLLYLISILYQRFAKAEQQGSRA